MTRAQWPVLRSTSTILRREFLGLLRSRKGFWIAVLTVAATSLIPLSSWPGAQDPSPAVSGRAAFERYRQVALLSLVLFVPLVSWTSLSAERKQNTLVMLLSTPLRPAGIVLGKYLSTAGFFLLLVALTFPMAAALYLLGGFKAWEFAEVLGTECAMILFLSLVSPWPSAHSWRERSPPPLPGPFTRPARPWQRAWRAWPISKILSRAKEGVPDGSNPILVVALRNVLSAFFTDWGCLPVALTLCLLVSTADPRGWSMGLVVSLLSLAAAVICPALACNLLVSERERRTLDLLRATPLGPLEIVGGKLRAVLLTSLVFLIAGAITCAVLIPFHGGTGVLKAFLLLGGCSVTILDSATAGLVGAVLSRTRQQAMVLAYLLASGYLVLLPLSVREATFSPLAALFWSTFKSDDLGYLALSLGIGLQVAGTQFALALVIFEMAWMRHR